MRENELAQTIDLSGDWQFLSPQSQSWQEIQVPASWESQGTPFRIDGPFHYQKKFQLPADWAGKRIFLEFGGVSYACQASCNSTPIGDHRGMWTPFAFELSVSARPGSENTIELEVTKPGAPGSRYPMRSSLAGFIPDIAGAFGGIWQPVRVAAYAAALSNLSVLPDISAQAVQVDCAAEIFIPQPARLEWQVQVFHAGQRIAHETLPYISGKNLNTRVALPMIEPWSPDHPALFQVQISLRDDAGVIACASRSVGFRRLSAAGDQLLLNGKPYLIRGILGWGWDPQTIAPYLPLEQARAQIREIKHMGFNCLKLCLYVPNPAFYQAADEEGLLLWQEFPLWLPEITPALRAQAPGEYAEITALTRSHPSVALYSLGCELNREVDAGILDQLNQTVRERVCDVLVCDNSGSGESYAGLDIDFADFNDYHPYYDIHYFEPLLNHWRRDWLPQRPWIFGEFCDSDTFRNLNEIIQANGGAAPWWLTRENPVTDWRSEGQAVLDQLRRVADHGLNHSVPELVRSSYAQAQVIRKYTLETLRRRSAIGGYIITGLRDTPISTSGVWDDLGRPKWAADEYLLTNSADILCLDAGRRRTWRNGGDRPDPIDPFNLAVPGPAHWQVILHCAERDLPAPSQLTWRLEDSQGAVVGSGEGSIPHPVVAGRPSRITAITCDLPNFTRAEILQLTLVLQSSTRSISNHWPVWVYPSSPLPTQLETLMVYDPQGFLPAWGFEQTPFPLSSKTIQRRSTRPSPHHAAPMLATTWDAYTEAHFNAGGKIVYLQSGEGPLPARRLPFWREAIKLFAWHPLWQDFPHQGFSDMQFFAIAGDLAFDTPRLAQALPPGSTIHPVLRRFDAREFHLSEYIFEAISPAGGKLLACSLPLNGGSGAQPTGLRRNIAGAALLRAMVSALLRVNQ